MTRLLLAAVAVAVLSQPVHAYLQFTTTSGSQTIAVKWQRMPVRWFVKDRGVPGVSASEFQAAVSRAFATWQEVPTASISFEFGGFTGSEPFDDDGASVLGFRNAPEMDQVLGATTLLIDTVTGEIVEADIFFNSSFQWSTAAAGDPLRFDLESVAVHEIGHLLGLGHSALGETEVDSSGGRRVVASGAVMFPISFGRGVTLDRELQPDDIAGASDLYPDGGFREETGVARGRITRNGVGILGAHVTAFNLETGRLIAAFTLNRDGQFQIAGLTPGPHVVRVEPLDDGDIESFFEPRDPIDLTFRVTLHNRLVVVPRGGAAEQFTVSVQPK